MADSSYNNNFEPAPEEKRSLTDTLTMYKQLKMLTDGVPQVIFLADSEGKVIFWNHRFLELSGLSLSNALTNRWQDLIHPDDAPGYRREWMRCVASGVTFEHIFRMSRVMPGNILGEYRWYSVRAVSKRDETDRIVEWYGTISEWQAPCCDSK